MNPETIRIRVQESLNATMNKQSILLQSSLECLKADFDRIFQGAFADIAAMMNPPSANTATTVVKEEQAALKVVPAPQDPQA